MENLWLEMRSSRETICARKRGRRRRRHSDVGHTERNLSIDPETNNNRGHRACRSKCCVRFMVLCADLISDPSLIYVSSLLTITTSSGE